ncbi:MAG: hypothetical protein ACLFUZ_04850 [Candidatus Micrarchaeia archaeon]
MTRELFLLLLLFPACAALEDPPLDEVAQHNRALAPSLMGTSAVTVGELTKDNYSVVNMTIVAVIPSVDRRISPTADEVLWAWNEETADGRTITEEDSNGCTDRYMFTLINQTESIEISFSFRNHTVKTEPETTEAILEIPLDRELLETANGTENLTIELEWDYWYQYEVIVSNSGLVCDGENCSCEDQGSMPPQQWELHTIGNVSRQYIVEPGNASFFLARPALAEQWYRNNHFDTLIFSRKSIYKAEIEKNGNKTGYARIYNFSVMEDPLGAWHITVNETQEEMNASMENYELSYWANPVVKENNSFSHLYEVNHTYEAWGPRNMSITVTDFFGGKHTCSREILSRKLTKGGMSETGEPEGSPEYYRQGMPAQEEKELARNIIPSDGLLLIFLIAALWMFWYHRRHAR